MTALSVLDLSYVPSGVPASQALRNSIDLARHVDGLGYARYWLAEHHNLPSVASPAPEIMIGQIAAVTRNLRVGSGGVMLPNHAPLAVAERYKMLEGLFPRRIDLGLGRAPGTDGVTAYALRRRQDADADDDFLQRLQELVLWDTREFPAQHPFNNVIAMPNDAPLPPIFLLGSSDYSAQLSGVAGLGFGFAHHFASFDAGEAMRLYRGKFSPSRWRATPHAILAIAVIAADTDAEAEKLATSFDLTWLLRRKGQFGPIPSVEEAAAYPYTEQDRRSIAERRTRLFAGTVATIKTRLAPLLADTQPDEVMITTAIHDHEARKHSYTLMANALADVQAGVAAPAAV